MRLVQLLGPKGRRVACVEEPKLRLLRRSGSIYDLACSALADEISLSQAVQQQLSEDVLDYDPVYSGSSEWGFLPAADCPSAQNRCLVSGTGLTHMASAKNRDAMHAETATITDSTRMYRWGLEGGRPAEGKIGISPEWFYKGPGGILRGHNQPLEVPDHAEDGGEEPEIAGVYIVDESGAPRRIGFATGNEFSDHVFEKKNYLYLASSKLRQCSIGPELVLEAEFSKVAGQVSIHRAGKTIWEKQTHSGEEVMCHSLANIEHHHFKFEAHRQAGAMHVHFFGADAFSFGEGLQLEDGDVMQVQFEGYGRALRNPVHRVPAAGQPISVTRL